MNERIKELVKQAGGHFSTRNLMSNPVQHRESIELWDDRIEKFAELIVAECVNRVTSKANGWGDMTGFAIKESILDCANDLKQHFGVEE